MAGFIWELEKAANGRSRCKGCSGAIVKDEIRLSISMDTSDMDIEDSRRRHILEAPKRYHLKDSCIRTFRKTPAWWAANTPPVEEVGNGELIGPQKLERLLDRLRSGETGGAADSSSSDADDGVAAKEEKLKDQDADDAGDQAEEDEESSSAPAAKKATAKKATTGTKRKKPSAAAEATYQANCLAADQVEEIRSQIQELRSLTNKQLQDKLRRNKLKVTGKKEELLERCAEAIVLGAPPMCPMCKRGLLRFDRDTGSFSCPGYNDGGHVHRCKFTGDVKRKRWREEDDAESAASASGDDDDDDDNDGDADGNADEDNE